MNRQVYRTIAEVRDNDSASQTRKITYVLSTSDRDRHNTVLNMDGWELDNYRKNPIVLYAHQSSGKALFTQPDPDNVIGKMENIRLEKTLTGKALLGDVIFEPERINPKAEKLYQKVKFGSLTRVSVGFMEVGQGKFGTGDEARGAANETYYFSGQELLEVSIVDLPSNPNAGKREISEAGVQYAARALSMDPKQLRGLDVSAVLEMMEKKSEPKTPREIEQERISAQSRLNNLKFNTMKQPQSLFDVIQAATRGSYNWEDYEINRQGVRQMEKAGLTLRPQRNQVFIPIISRATLEADSFRGSTPYIPGIDIANATILPQLGVRILTDQAKDVTVPSLTGVHSAFADVYDPDTESASLETITLTDKRVSAFLAHSIDARFTATPQGKDYLTNALQQKIGEAIEAAIFGTLASSTSRPQGMAYAATTGADTAVAAAAPSIASLRTLEDEAFANGFFNGQYAYVTNIGGFRNIADVFLGTSYNFMTPTTMFAHEGFNLDFPGRRLFGFVNGFPAYCSNNVSAIAGTGGDGNALFFGNWSRMILVFFGSAILTIDNATSAKYGINKMYLDVFCDVKGMDGAESTGVGTDDYDYKGFGCLPLT